MWMLPPPSGVAWVFRIFVGTPKLKKKKLLYKYAEKKLLGVSYEVNEFTSS